MKGLTKNCYGMYKLRLRIPACAKSYFERDEINKSLETKHLRTAKNKALIFIEKFYTLISVLKMQIMPYEQTQKLVDDFLYNTLQLTKSASSSKDYKSILQPTKDKSYTTYAQAYELFKRFYSTQPMNENTKSDTFRVLDKLMIIVGPATNIQTSNTEQMIMLQETLTNLPNMNKHPYKAMKFEEILLLNEIPRTDVITDNRLQGYIKHIKKFYSFCYDDGIIKHNPAHRLGKCVSSHAKEAFTDEEMHKLIAIINTLEKHLAILYLVYIYTGMRREELYNSVIEEVSDIKFFSIKKGKNLSALRAIPLHNKLLVTRLDNEVLEAARNAISFNALGRKFNEVIKPKVCLDKSKTLHSLRHTFATKLQNAYVPDELIKQLMGHSPKDTLNRVYTSGRINIQNETKLLRCKNAINALTFEE